VSVELSRLANGLTVVSHARRDVILQEIASSVDSPEDMVFDLVQEMAFPDQPVGRPILGTSHSVKNFKASNLSTYLSCHYRGDNMVLAAAGAVDHASLLDEAERRLGQLATGRGPEPEPARYRGGVARSEKPFEQTHMVLGFEAPDYRHPDFYAAQLCAGALGGGMSSRLFQEARERRGLCYAINAFASGLSDSGLFAVYAACGPDRAVQLLDVVRNEFLRAAESGFSGDELARVKAQVKMALLAGLESGTARAEQLARQLLIHGRPLTTEELIERIEAVTPADLQRQVELLLQSPISLATVGPILNVARFDSLAAKFVVPPMKAA
jgi:predicted Zn-dependent peptidase